MQLLNGVNKLPSLEAVAPPVIKPEMVEEAKFLQAARALQRYASSGDEESDGDSAWETQPRKRSRTQVGAWAQRSNGSSSRELGRESHPKQHARRGSLNGHSARNSTWQDSGPPPDEVEETSHKGSKVRDVLLAMAEIAQPSSAQPGESEDREEHEALKGVGSKAEIGEEEEQEQEEEEDEEDEEDDEDTNKQCGSALSMLRSASSSQLGQYSSRPSSTDVEGLSRDTMSPMEGHDEASPPEVDTQAPRTTERTSDVDLTMVNLLSELATGMGSA